MVLSQTRWCERKRRIADIGGVRFWRMDAEADIQPMSFAAPRSEPSHVLPRTVPIASPFERGDEAVSVADAVRHVRW